MTNPSNQDEAEWFFQDDEEVGHGIDIDCDIHSGPMHSGVVQFFEGVAYPLEYKVLLPPFSHRFALEDTWLLPGLADVTHMRLGPCTSAPAIRLLVGSAYLGDAQQPSGCTCAWHSMPCTGASNMWQHDSGSLWVGIGFA